MTIAEPLPMARHGAAGLARLLRFAVSPSHHLPREEFRDAVLSQANHFFSSRQALLLELDERSLDFLATAGIDVAPESLMGIRVRLAEGGIGRALLNPSATILAETISDMPFLQSPVAFIPIRVESRAVAAIILAAAPGGFLATADLALLQSTVALVFTNHFYFEKAQGGRNAVTATLACALEKTGRRSQSPALEKQWIRNLGQALKLPESLIDEAERGIRLRDIGMLGVDPALLEQKGKLSDDDRAVIQKHPAMGFDILQEAPELRAVSLIVLTHQEWFNGKGYPEGLAGEEIPLTSRMVSVVDAWSAMLSERPYRKALSRHQAIAELSRLSGTQFDPRLVDAFLRGLENAGSSAAQTPA